MSVSVSVNNDCVELMVLGSFDFSLFNDFRTAYSQYIPEHKYYLVDMSEVEYLDSAALGMLLSMKKAVGEDCHIELRGPNSFIKDILMISRFDKLFTIS
ncbi:STAS domain-containing protein [Marinomonas epiphytica]